MLGAPDEKNQPIRVGFWNFGGSLKYEAPP
jgi:hypothetical protein